MRSYTLSVLSILQKAKALRLVVFVLAVQFCIPFFASAATLSFSPASGSYSVGSTFSVGVYVGSSDKAMNAASGIVTFPEDVLEVTSISKNQSVISLWVQEPSFANAQGTVHFEGVVPNPGYTGASGKIITVNFRVKAPGTAKVLFSASSVLANDGQGTEILSNRGSAEFTLAPQSPAIEIPPTTTVVNESTTPANETVPKAPPVQSISHPAENWSHETSGIFNFAPGEDVTAMRLLLDTIPTSIPTVVYQPPVSVREIKEIPEGISYLHVQYKNADGWGIVSHYKLQVDTKAPSDISVVQVEGETAQTATFTFDAKDDASGITRYEVLIDGAGLQTLLAQGTYTFTTPSGLSDGAHTLNVKAYDAAGNFVETTRQFSVTTTKKVDTDTPQSSPAYATFFQKAEAAIMILSVVVPFVALVLLLSVLLFMIWRAYGGLRKRIAKEVLEAKMIVHKAFTLLRDDLQDDIKTLEKASKKRKLTREEAKILKRLRQNIDEAEKVISDEMIDIEKVV